MLLQLLQLAFQLRHLSLQLLLGSRGAVARRRHLLPRRRQLRLQRLALRHLCCKGCCCCCRRCCLLLLHGALQVGNLGLGRLALRLLLLHPGHRAAGCTSIAWGRACAATLVQRRLWKGEHASLTQCSARVEPRAGLPQSVTPSGPATTTTATTTARGRTLW